MYYYKRRMCSLWLISQVKRLQKAKKVNSNATRVEMNDEIRNSGGMRDNRLEDERNVLLN